MSSIIYAVLSLLAAICAGIACYRHAALLMWLFIILSNLYDIHRKLEELRKK